MLGGIYFKNLHMRLYKTRTTGVETVRPYMATQIVWPCKSAYGHMCINRPCSCYVAMHWPKAVMLCSCSWEVRYT